MLLQILDGNGTQQTIIAHGQEAVLDSSGTINATGIAQVAMLQNAQRSGWIMQNCGVNQQIVNELGAAAVGSGSFIVQPGEFFPPANFPVTTGIISIMGTIGDAFTMRQW